MYWRKGYISLTEKVYFIKSLYTGRGTTVVPRGTGAPLSLSIENKINQTDTVPATLFAI